MTDVYLQECLDRAPIDWAGGFDLMKSSKRRDDYIGGAVEKRLIK